MRRSVPNTCAKSKCDYKPAKAKPNEGNKFSADHFKS